MAVEDALCAPRGHSKAGGEGKSGASRSTMSSKVREVLVGSILF